GTGDGWHCVERWILRGVVCPVLRRMRHRRGEDELSMSDGPRMTFPDANPPSFLSGDRELLKRTTSRCPVCHASCPAEVWRVNARGGGAAQVFLQRTCPLHGEASACIASDARFY